MRVNLQGLLLLWRENFPCSRIETMHRKEYGDRQDAYPAVEGGRARAACFTVTFLKLMAVMVGPTS
jgi:hypothetical protein